MNNINTKWVNPAVLKNLREKLNLTPKEVEELSKKLKRQYFEPISALQLIEWEEGKKAPELIHLETLAEIYHCPVGYFFLDEVVEEKIPLSYRGLSEDKKLSYYTKISLKQFYELANFVVDLIKELDIEWKVKVEPREIPKDFRLLDQIASQIRSSFEWNEETKKRFDNKWENVFKWWREKIENLGVFCFESKLESKEIRGASLWLGSFPFILVNYQDSFAGKIFTLLHEYIHLLYEKEGIMCDFRGVKKGKNPEPFTNRLVARILLTKRELENRLSSLNLFQYKEWWSDKELDKIRKPFFVSRDVIAIMLQEIGLAPPNFYELKIKEWENKGIWRKWGKKPTKKEQKLKELGNSFARLLVYGYRKPYFPLFEISTILNMKVEKAEEFIRWISKKL